MAKKIAMESEAKEIGGQGYAISKKCCSKLRAIELGCDVNGSYEDKELVALSDLEPSLWSTVAYFAKDFSRVIVEPKDAPTYAGKAIKKTIGSGFTSFGSSWVRFSGSDTYAMLSSEQILDSIFYAIGIDYNIQGEPNRTPGDLGQIKYYIMNGATIQETKTLTFYVEEAGIQGRKIPVKIRELSSFSTNLYVNEKGHERIVFGIIPTVEGDKKYLVIGYTRTAGGSGGISPNLELYQETARLKIPMNTEFPVYLRIGYCTDKCATGVYDTEWSGNCKVLTKDSSIFDNFKYKPEEVFLNDENSEPLNTRVTQISAREYRIQIRPADVVGKVVKNLYIQGSNLAPIFHNSEIRCSEGVYGVAVQGVLQNLILIMFMNPTGNPDAFGRLNAGDEITITSIVNPECIIKIVIS